MPDTLTCGEIAGKGAALWELLLVVLGAGCLCAYHLYFFKTDPERKMKAVFWFADTANTMCVKKMLSDEHGVTPVQALRNQMMTIFFYGEMSFGALTVIISASSVMDLTCTIRTLGSNDPVIGGYHQAASPMAKVQAIALVLAGIFGCMMQCLNILNQVSVMISCSGTKVLAHCVSSTFDCSSHLGCWCAYQCNTTREANAIGARFTFGPAAGAKRGNRSLH